MSSVSIRAVVWQTLKRVTGVAYVRDALEKSAAARRQWIRAADIIAALGPFAPGSFGPPDLICPIALAGAARTPELLAMLPQAVASPLELDRFCSESSEQDAERLGRLFQSYGSDKSTMHNYHRLYAKVLASAGPVTKLLEIGMGSNNDKVASNMAGIGSPGGSLRAFRDFLPEARIFGADIDPGVLFGEERIETCVVDQTDRASLAGLGERTGGDFDVIIDDGLHAPHANLCVLIFAIQHLRPGGWLVIEDITLPALPVWQVAIALLQGRGCQSSVVKTRRALAFVLKKAA